MARIIEWKNRLCFFCPGCKEKHCIEQGRWTFNGNFEKPTLTPSVLMRSGHFADGNKDTCWCTYNAEQEAKGEPKAPFECEVCHSFITDGQIQFLNDCTHELAGQTVELPEVPTD